MPEPEHVVALAPAVDANAIPPRSPPAPGSAAVFSECELNGSTKSGSRFTFSHTSVVFSKARIISSSGRLSALCSIAARQYGHLSPFSRAAQYVHRLCPHGNSSNGLRSTERVTSTEASVVEEVLGAAVTLRLLITHMQIGHAWAESRSLTSFSSSSATFLWVICCVSSCRTAFSMFCESRDSRATPLSEVSAILEEASSESECSRIHCACRVFRSERETAIGDWLLVLTDRLFKKNALCW
mmetsp:Transcript_3313/g.7792  ORF Transcript_3313/g.7792 Transcript_3313/m.7792 type:complete len:241 (-) Transcript_3313:63-785(-)